MDTVIEIKHLEKHFGNLRVLNDIDFTIERGKVVTIIGSSGSGNFMTRMTALLATLFFIISLVLGNINSNKTDKGSEWENLSAPVKTEQTQPAAPAKPTSDIPN